MYGGSRLTVFIFVSSLPTTQLIHTINIHRHPGHIVSERINFGQIKEVIQPPI